MDNNTCKMKGCCKEFFIGSAAVFIFLFAAGYVIHHLWLMPIYQQTAALWRPMDQMQALFPWLIVYYAVLSVVITALFCKIKKAKMQACEATGETDCKIGGKNCPIKCGVCFGTIIGLFMGTLCAGSYIWMPIPGELIVKWVIGDIVQGIGIGLILSFLCTMKKA